MAKSVSKLIRFLLLTIIFSVWVSQSALSCELTMGYRTNERAPLIAKSPDNSGLYKDLFSTAASRIGCTLKIIREPKKRVLNQLKKGEIDFYPGFNFNEKRAEYAYYIVNGLPGGDIGISHQGINNITDLNQLKGKVMLVALGSPEWGAKEKGIKLKRPSELDVPTAVKLISENKGDFYIYNRGTLEYYLKNNPNDKIKTHRDCCGGKKTMYLGFSRKASNMNEVQNPDYKAESELSPANFPTQPGAGSVAEKFAAALAEMSASGETQAIYDKYYK